jgi:hypothetical protein
MLKDLPDNARALAQYMSSLSEEAWRAGWMLDLEYHLWTALLDGTGRYGRLSLTDSQISRLRSLSQDCGGWVRFDDVAEETFVPLVDWVRVYAAWQNSKGSSRAGA